MGAVDFDLHRVYPQLRPAVGPYDMPAGIGLVARNRHAEPARRGQGLLDEPFPRAVAEPVADDDSGAVARLTRRTARHAVQVDQHGAAEPFARRKSEEHTSELKSLMRISYADSCLKKKKH